MGSQGSCLGKIDLPETWRSVQLAVLNLPLTIRYSTNELPNYTRTCAESTMLPSGPIPPIATVCRMVRLLRNSEPDPYRFRDLLLVGVQRPSSGRRSTGPS